MASRVEFTNESLREAVNLWFDDQKKADSLYGHISTWDTSGVTDMYRLFFRRSDFNEDICGWDVSNVTTMKYMFAYAEAFNQPLGGWDVSNVTDMEGMFYCASSFNKPLEDWDVSNVTTMEEMFAYAKAFNQNLGNWKLSPEISSIEAMFYCVGILDTLDTTGWEWIIPKTTKTRDFAWFNQGTCEKLFSLITPAPDTN